jgi:hypothetical protein
MMTATFAQAQPFSFNICYRRVSNTQPVEEHAFDSLSGGPTLYHPIGGSENTMHAGSNLISNGTAMPVTTRGVVGGVFNNASSLMEINAATVSSFSGTAGTTTLDGLTLATQGGGGGSRQSNIEVQEFIVFSGAHTSAQLKADNATMRAAWRF